MIGCDIQNHGNISAEVVHIIQHKTGDLQNVSIMLLSSYLQGKAISYISS